MKGCLPSLAALAAVALLVFAGGTPAPESSFGSTAVVQLEADVPQVAVTQRETPQDVAPLVVGPPSESLIVLTNTGELYTEPKLTEPVKIVPVVSKKDAAAGHWEYRQSCGRGGCSMQQIWVPNGPQAAPVAQQSCGSCSSASSCGPGGCGVRRGLFGRRR